MKRRRQSQIIVGVFLTAIAIALYWPWFGHGFISYGDWWYRLPEQVTQVFHHLLFWNGGSNLGTGMSVGSGNNVIIYWVDWLYGLLYSVFHIPVSVSVRLVWFVPYAFFSFFSAWYLGYALTKRQLVGVVLAIIYPLSTFVIVGIQGGQLTITLAYALAPLAIGLLYRLLTESKPKLALWLGIVMVLQAVYDIRIAYLTIGAIVLMLLYNQVFVQKTGRMQKNLLKQLGTVVVTGILLSSYWLIHLVIKPSGAASPLPAGYNNVSWAHALSYVTLPNAYATTHVWWPWSEGAQLPIQPLFYGVIILAVVGLTTWRRNRFLPYFFGLFLIGVFLAKGTNPPVGMAYDWLFQHIPGFSLFRDPAKFFTLVMLGVAPVAAVGALTIVEHVRPRFRWLAIAAVVIILLAPQYSIFFGSRHGTFVTKTLPPEYQRLADWETAQTQWGRVLWIPRAQRHVVELQNVPSVDYLTMTAASWSAFLPQGETGAATLLRHPYGPWLLQQAGVRYIGVPVDTYDELYRNFGSQDYWQAAAANFAKTTPVSGLGGIALYPLSKARDEVYLANTAVLVDATALTAAKNLPLLTDADVLVQSPEDATYTAPNVRQAVMSLKPVPTQPGSWTFYAPQALSGEVVADAVLAGRSVTFDGHAPTTTTTFERGWHTLTVADDHNQVIQQQPAARYHWRGCSGEPEPSNQFSSRPDGTVSLAPVTSTIRGCADLDFGTLSEGVYKITFAGQEATGVQGVVERTDEVGSISRVELADGGGSYLFLLPETRPVSMQFLATLQPGGESGVVTLGNITVERLLFGIPHAVELRRGVATGAVLLPQWKKVSNRQYQITVPTRTEGAYLVLNQGYSTGWQLRGIDGATHIPVNGGLNGWYLPAGDTATVTVSYWYVWPFWLGVGITLVTIVTIVGILRKQNRHDA